MKVDVLFATGKSTITSSDHETLQKVVDFMNQYPHAKITVEGYTDSRGSPVLNRRLSLSRAKAVRETLIKMGADGARLDAKGFGAAHPIASNATEEGRAMNRRVVATAHAESTATPEAKPVHKAMKHHGKLHHGKLHHRVMHKMHHALKKHLVKKAAQ